MAAQPLPDLKAHLASLFVEALAQVAPGTAAAVMLERPRQTEHGDFACNVALQLAKQLKRNPRELAQALVGALPPSEVLERAEIAGAGFINLYLRADAKRGVIAKVLAAGDAYGNVGYGQGKKVQVEFVSANPTGPLHVGHGRGAAYGASLSSSARSRRIQRRDPRILRQRCRPADGYPGPVHLDALPRTQRCGAGISAERLSGRTTCATWRAIHAAARQALRARCRRVPTPFRRWRPTGSASRRLIANAKRLLGDGLHSTCTTMC